MRNTLSDEWTKYVLVVKSGTFYSVISLKEKMDIIKAVVDASFGESHRRAYEGRCADIGSGTGGRFYQVSDVKRRQDYCIVLELVCEQR
jgi:hypothetical protein